MIPAVFGGMATAKTMFPAEFGGLGAAKPLFPAVLAAWEHNFGSFRGPKWSKKATKMARRAVLERSWGGLGAILGQACRAGLF